MTTRSPLRFDVTTDAGVADTFHRIKTDLRPTSSRSTQLVTAEPRLDTRPAARGIDLFNLIR